jgi:lipoprotein-anchoring transpeptidase ErfK/SrfK
VEGVLDSVLTQDTTGTYTHHGDGKLRFYYAGGYEPTRVRSGNIRMGFPVWGFPIPGVEHYPYNPMGLFVREGSEPTPY